jgi:hypothetical protein
MSPDTEWTLQLITKGIQEYANFSRLSYTSMNHLHPTQPTASPTLSALQLLSGNFGDSRKWAQLSDVATNL